MPADEQRPATTRRRAVDEKSFDTTILTGDNLYQGGPPIRRESVRISKSLQISGTQFTVSEGHPGFPPKGVTGRKNDLQDRGGDFLTIRKSFLTPIQARKVKAFGKPSTDYGYGYTQAWAEYFGPYLATAPPTSDTDSKWPPSARSSNDALDELGTTAIARCKPTNSLADLGSSLGEIFRDGLPHLIGHTTWKSKTRASRKAGSEYLNIQFGWKPLISDVSNFASAVSRADAVISQYERDAGKVVRRQFRFPKKTTESTEVLSRNATPWSTIQNTNLSGDGSAVLTRKRVTVVEQWFSGAFTYHLPTGYDSRSAMSRYALFADRVGLTLSPNVLWELAPWSWAVDWFTNTGDVISNVQDFASHGLVLRYGYIMEHSIVTDTYTLTGGRYYDGSSLSASSLTLVNETKVRRKATPFGFGVKWEGLSPFQLSIIAALGLSRRR